MTSGGAPDRHLPSIRSWWNWCVRRRAVAVLVAGVGVGVAGSGVGYAARGLLRRQAARARAVIGTPLGEQPPHADRVWTQGVRRPAGPAARRRLDRRGPGRRAAQGHPRRAPVQGPGRADLHRAVRLRTVAGRRRREQHRWPPSWTRWRRRTGPTWRWSWSAATTSPTGCRWPRSTAHLAEAVLRAAGAGRRGRGGHLPRPGGAAAGAAAAARPRLAAPRASWRPRRPPAAAARRCARGVARPGRSGRSSSTNPDEMFSLDRFHPSALGYRRTAEALLPSVLTGLLPAEPPTSPAPCRGGRLHPVVCTRPRRVLNMTLAVSS